MALSSQMDKVKAMQVPFPIYTAISAENLAAENLWYEFTPLEIGATWIGPQGMYVPSWAFGRKFKNGTSVNFAPEQNFGVLMGTFGLAIGITITRLIQEVGLRDKIQTMFVKNIIDRILQEAGEKRLTSSDFANYTYQLAGSKYATLPVLKLVDAGIHINLPFTPVMGERPERVADIVIFVDASGDNLGNDLKITADFARSKGFKFPQIDYAMVTKRVPTMFKDDNDPSVPVVIYVPRIVDPQLINEKRNQLGFQEKVLKIENFNVEQCIKSGPCATFNFKNNEAQARTMTSLGAINMMAIKDLFAQAVSFKAGVSLGVKQAVPAAPIKPQIAPSLPVPVAPAA
jgi:phospholipase A2